MSTVITASGLSKRYKQTLALDNVSFQIEPGRIVGLIGPNGAGKTTALKAILGLTDFGGRAESARLRPAPAARQADGRGVFHRRRGRAAALDQGEARRSISSPTCTRASIAAKCEAFLARTKLTPTNACAQMSKGMIVQLHLALVMAIDARLLILDEPTLGLDILYRKQFYQSLLEDYFDENKTIIVTTHQVEEVEHILTDLMFIRDGKIVLDADMDAIGERFIEVMVNADRADAARAAETAGRTPGVRQEHLPVRRRAARAAGSPGRDPPSLRQRPVRRHHERNLRMKTGAINTCTGWSSASTGNTAAASCGRQSSPPACSCC